MDVVEPWTKGGLCEYQWQRGALFPVCRKRARWMVNGELRCGGHKTGEKRVDTSESSIDVRR